MKQKVWFCKIEGKEEEGSLLLCQGKRDLNPRGMQWFCICAAGGAITSGQLGAGLNKESEGLLGRQVVCPWQFVFWKFPRWLFRI